jgi:PTH1 family peptidyl-tRNA hydrolase
VKIIVGLGNPGAQYKFTRHNIGFRIIDRFALQIAGSKIKWKKKFLAQIIDYTYNKQNLILVKPQTYMNLSGRTVKEITDYYRINYNQLLIIYDDFYLPLGRIRIRKKGSAGGHHGMESIINSLKSIEIPRMRIGIRNDNQLENLDYSDFVLSHFLPEEEQMVEDTIIRAVAAVKEIIESGLEYAMRKYNRLDDHQIK